MKKIYKSIFKIMDNDYKKYNQYYHKDYYDNLGSISYNAAKIILGDLYKIYKFKSVVDLVADLVGGLSQPGN